MGFFLKELLCSITVLATRIQNCFLNALCISVAFYEVNQRPEKEKLSPYQAVYWYI